jgi:hypothetical protein
MFYGHRQVVICKVKLVSLLKNTNVRPKMNQTSKGRSFKLALHQPPPPAQRTTKWRPTLVCFMGSTLTRGNIDVPHWRSAYWVLKWKLRM